MGISCGAEALIQTLWTYDPLGWKQNIQSQHRQADNEMQRSASKDNITFFTSAKDVDKLMCSVTGLGRGFQGEGKIYFSVAIDSIKEFPDNGNAARMAIGLEGHFGPQPNIPYVRSTLDTLARANVPIWLTEIDVETGPGQAHHLEQVLREVYAHPAVHGIILWTAWHAKGCYVMCLTDNGFNNLATDDVVDKLIAEWKTRSHVGVADADGYYEAELFHEDYKVQVTYPAANSTVVQSMSVDRESDDEFTIHV